MFSLRVPAVSFAALCAVACDGGSGEGNEGFATPDAMGETPSTALVPDNDLALPGPGYTAPGALAFRVVDGITGAVVAPATFWQTLSVARFVCAGEVHNDFFAHSLQYLIARTLGARQPGGMTIAFEQFEVGFQSVLDQFSAGLLDETQLLQQSQYVTRWGFDWPLYRPIVLLGPQRKHLLLAVNPAQELTRKVTEGGLASLSPAEQAQLPELDLMQAAHREWFRAQISGAHGAVTGERFENLYASQVIRDETMAAQIAGRLAQPGAERVVGIIGFGHCVRYGVPQRAARRGLTGIVTIRTALPTQSSVDEALTGGLYDFVVVPGL
jgi:uncharacterized iron-regulated protein